MAISAIEALEQEYVLTPGGFKRVSTGQLLSQSEWEIDVTFTFQDQPEVLLAAQALTATFS